MAQNNRVFVSFAIEDERSRDFLCGQAKNARTPFAFVDMSVKEPWDSNWKTNCRAKIRGCDGMIAMVSHNTAKATGQLWEVACAKEERIPVLGVYIDANNKPWSLPTEFSGVKILDWTWDNIATFTNSL